MIFVIVVLAIILGCSLFINWAFLYKSIHSDGILEVDETDPDDVKMRLVTKRDIDVSRAVLFIRIEKKKASGSYPWGS